MSTRDAIEAERERRRVVGHAFDDVIRSGTLEVCVANGAHSELGARFLYFLTAKGYDVTRKDTGNDTRHDTSGIREPEEIPGDRRSESRHP
jgi:hypothetical protein